MAVVETPRAGGLLEREEPLERLRAAFAGARDGRGALLFVGGGAGVGKTALANASRTSWTPTFSGDYAIRSSRRRPSGRCSRSPRGRATGADAFREDAGAHAIATALLDPPRARAPLMLVLEDLHWADEATLDALRVLGRRVGHDADPGRRDVPRRRARPGSPAPNRPRRARHDVCRRASRRGAALARGGRGARGGSRRRRRGAPSPDLGQPLLRHRGARCRRQGRSRDGARRRARPRRASERVGRRRCRGRRRSRLRCSTRLLTIAVCGDASDSVDECLATGVLVAVDGRRSHSATSSRASPSRRRCPRRGAWRSTAGCSLALTDRPHGAADLARIAHHAEHAADARGGAPRTRRRRRAGDAPRSTSRGRRAVRARALASRRALSPEEQRVAPRAPVGRPLPHGRPGRARSPTLEHAIEHHLRAGALDRAAAARGRLVPYLTCRGLLAEAEDSATQSIAVLGELPESALLADATAAMALICGVPRSDRPRARSPGASGRWSSRDRLGEHREAHRRARSTLGTVELFRDRRVTLAGADARRGTGAAALAARRARHAQPRARFGCPGLARVGRTLDRGRARALRRPRARSLATGAVCSLRVRARARPVARGRMRPRRRT